MVWEILSLLFSLAAIGLVLFLCYKGSKFMAGKVNAITSSSNVKILERALLGQDKGLAVIEVCKKYYLIGFSSTNIDILKELDDYVPAEPTVPQLDFLGALKDSVAKYNAKKAGEKKDNANDATDE